MDALGADAVACVCAVVDFASALHLLATCRRLYGMGRDDTFFRLVAELQWGRQFWRDALTRPTRRVFRSMREELIAICRFQRCVRRHEFKPWGEREFRCFWISEALMVDATSC